MSFRMSIDDPALLPLYANDTDAGCDLRSAEDVIIPAKEYVLVHTGVRIALEEGYVGLVHPRSGLALKHGITVLNAPGTIDAGYRGEIGVILHNVSDRDFAVVRGDRIAQLVIQEYVSAAFFAQVGADLGETERGEGGFGSTGVS